MKYQRFLVLLIAFLIIFIVSVTYNEAQSEDTWAISTVDSTGYVGYFTSIAIDSNNKIHISYCDGTNDALKYATNVLGSWTTYTIDSPGYAGESTSIAIDLNYRCLAPCPCFFIKCLLYLPLVDAAFHKLESGCEINKTVGIIALVAFKGVIFETNYSLCLYFNPFSKPFSAAVYA